MSEVRNEISKMTIRGELNFLFTLSKMIVSILDAAEDNQIAADTLRTVADSLLDQAAYCCGKLRIYTEDLDDSKLR